MASQDLKRSALGKCTTTEKCERPLPVSGLELKMSPVILVGWFPSAVVED